MPKNIMNIQGLNPWNLLLINVLVGWLIQRRKENYRWDLPSKINILFLLYLSVIFVGFGRAVTDMALLPNFTVGSMISEYLINTVKWVVPSLLLFDGCRNVSHLKLGIFSILAMYSLLAIQVIRWMPMSSALSGSDLEARSRKIILNEIGYSRVNMSMIMSGASWAAVSLIPLTTTRRQTFMVVGLFLMLSYAQALTGGRMGYVTWGIVGFLLCTLRWRKLLLLIPVFVGVVFIATPGVVERMLSGFGEKSVSGEEVINDYNVTAGRTLIWPYVIEKIWESPFVGYGRLGMNRTGLNKFLLVQLREGFDHPHNAYLEWLLDNGIIGFILVIPFYVLIVFYSGRLLLDKTNPWYSAVGGMAMALVLALMVASMGSQTFYPREGAVGLWSAVGLMFRLHVERQKSKMSIPMNTRRTYRNAYSLQIQNRFVSG